MLTGSPRIVTSLVIFRRDVDGFDSGGGAKDWPSFPLIAVAAIAVA